MMPIRGTTADIKHFLPAVAESKAFLPETARRLGNALFTKDLKLTNADVARFVQEPIPFLISVLRGLDDKHLAALSLIFANGGSLPSPVILAEEERRTLSRLGASEAEAKVALNTMNGSLTHFEHGNEPKWEFKHATIRDALASLTATDPERLDIYLRGCPVDRLLAEVTCGDVGVKGVKVVVPSRYYSSFAQRLKEHRNGWAKYSFLAHRCDRAFLDTYLGADEGLLRDVRVGSWYLDSNPAVHLLSRLHESGLLPESRRLEFVQEARELAVATPDQTFLTDLRVRKMLSDRETTGILGAVREELLPSLQDVVEEWASRYPGDGDASGLFRRLRLALEAYGEALEDDPEARRLIEDALEAIEAEVSRLGQNDDADDAPRLVESNAAPASIGRSIFDDIDAD